jgi:uncharacterized membrane protein YdjX (TVP38/TMEM64 family)
VKDEIRESSLMAVALLRNLSIAPFSVVNIACGTAGLPRRNFLAGTITGMLPGIVLLSLFGREVGELFTDPTPAGVARAAGVALLILGGAFFVDVKLEKFGRVGRAGDAKSGTGPRKDR